jgi:hypothetical protein
MLHRNFTPLQDNLDRHTRNALEDTISKFMPSDWIAMENSAGPDGPMPLGYHLVYCNPALFKLLPDGTDSIHSPGGPFVRRVWGGGSLKMNLMNYWHHHHGFFPGSQVVCSECITDVKRRGSPETEKIIVTVERRFINMWSILVEAGATKRKNHKERRRYANAYNRSWEAGEGKDVTSLVEERQLIFMKQRTATELKEMEQGPIAPVRYLRRE